LPNYKALKKEADAFAAPAPFDYIIPK